MRDLVDRVLEFDKPATDDAVAAIKDFLGETTSLAALEQALKEYKADRDRILTGDLLEWMRENDLEMFENEDVKVKITTYVSPKIKDDEQAFKWLTDNEYGDLIKDTLAFPKGELTEEVEAELAERGLSYTKKSGIHHQSLKKIISDRLKAGESLPSEDDGMDLTFYDICDVKER